MGRREFLEEEKLKKLIYTFSIALVVSIVIFLTIFFMYNKIFFVNKKKNDSDV